MKIAIAQTIAHADLEKEGVAWATEILTKSPQAIRMLKYAMNMVDDGLVGQQLFAGDVGQWVQAGAGGPGQDDAFALGRVIHEAILLSSSSVVSTPACHGGRVTPNTCSKCDTSSRELAGRCAGVG